MQINMVSARQHTISAESNVKLQARNTDNSVHKSQADFRFSLVWNKRVA